MNRIDKAARARESRELNGQSHLVSGCAPPPAGPTHEVVQLRAGEQIDGAICSPAIWGVVTHWNDGAGPKGRSERCTADKGACTGCDRELPSRWKGYVHLFDLHKRQEVFLEITPGAFDRILTEAPKGGTLRGLRLKARRSKGGDQGRFECELHLYAGDIELLPRPRDPEPILEILWNWRR